MQTHIFYFIQIIRILKQSDTKSTDMTSSDHVHYEKFADEKFVTNADRPSSYYDILISINGELEAEIANKKEKILTGEINNIYFVNCSVSLLYLLSFSCLFLFLVFYYSLLKIN